MKDEYISDPTVIGRTRSIDLSVMPGGGRYEDVYGAWLKLFESIAMEDAQTRIIVHHAPTCWIPFLRYLGCFCEGSQVFFDHDLAVTSAVRATEPMDRTYVEVMCGMRPELTDALWKTDMQWKSGRLEWIHAQGRRRAFIVTNNGSFHRPEILDYLEILKNYKPTKKKVVLVPCAADKPYPSKLHQAVLDILPDDYYLMNATGVLGLVPQDLWGVMPYYDSGLPNEWRLMHVAMDYFGRNYHTHIICYTDFYNLSLQAAFDLMFQRDLWPKPTGFAYPYPIIDFVNEVKFYADYIDLLDPAKLSALQALFAKD